MSTVDKLSHNVFEYAKRIALEKGVAFIVMFGERNVYADEYEERAKSKARMWRDFDKTPNVKIRRIRLGSF